VTNGFVWSTRGFEAFREGTCGNAGHNLYVSHAGILQRIHQYDLDGDGWFDLLFCNSQNHCEKPPVYVYRESTARPQLIELPSAGALSGAVIDLNGDGLDDLILGMSYDGIRDDFNMNALIYYGAPDGFSERRMQLLPAPFCTSVAAGDFNGDGRPDLAFLCRGKLRLFYQSDLGFEPKQFVDLNLAGDQLGADDIDGDGFADLLLRNISGEISVLWGGPDGLRIDRSTACRTGARSDESSATPAQSKQGEWVDPVRPLARSVRFGGRPHLFIAQEDRAFLVPVDGRRFGDWRTFDVRAALSVAVADLRGDGHDDLIFACRAAEKFSWIYWGSTGYDQSSRSRLPSENACDVAAADIDADGHTEIVLCQCHSEESFTTESLIYRLSDGQPREVARLVSHDARRVFLVKAPSGSGRDVVLVNHMSRDVQGRIPVYVYPAGPDGFSPGRRRDIPAWGAVESVCADLNDDSRPDLVLANAAENAQWLTPPSYIYLQDGQGFPPRPSLTLPTLRAHGCCCADLNRDGYLDLIFEPDSCLSRIENITTYLCVGCVTSRHRQSVADGRSSNGHGPSTTAAQFVPVTN